MSQTSEIGPSTGLSRFLLVASRCLTFIPMITIGLLLSAGTFLDHHESRPAILTLGLKSLAMISFDGIIPLNKTHSPDSSNYYVTLHKFPNAFGWECEDCPSGPFSPEGFVELAGVAETGPYAGSDPLAQMLHIGDKIFGSYSHLWDCFRDAPSRPGDIDCPESIFFETWSKRFHDFWLTGLSEIPISFIVYICSLLLVVMILVNEVLISYVPRHMKCLCPFGKSWCFYPKGKREDIEVLPEHRWDRIRVFSHMLLLSYLLLGAVQDTIMPMFYLIILRFIDNELPEGMSMRPRQNRPYLVLLWLNVLASTLAVAFAAWRYHMNKSNGHITLDDLAAYESEGRNGATVEPTAEPAAQPAAQSVAEQSVVDSDADDGSSEASESDALLGVAEPESRTAVDSTSY